MRLVRGVVVVCVVVVMVVSGLQGQGGNPQKCRDQRLCRECIQTTGCLWCSNPLVEGDDHCQLASTVKMSSFCRPGDIQNPVNNMTLVEDEELSGAEGKKQGEQGGEMDTDDIIQLRPQRVKLRLRKGTTKTISITYKRAHGYPVDLYYLMDLSNSMERDKKNLAELGGLLTETMTNLTTQFTLGFGSFVDKVMMPFTSATRLGKEKPCAKCAFPYSFRNDMKLSKDHKQFKDRVKAAQISGNLDHPEGGFDALMQAMVCKEKIGWRDVARKILVFSTDARFHQAGDGRLAGVVLPNDETCHLDNNHEYVAFDQYDYPSIGQINKVAKERNINIIFAVLDYLPLYKDLSKKIETSSVGKLEAGSSNVVDFIKEQYHSISSSVILTDNSTNDINIRYRSRCKGNTIMDTDRCDNILENDTITFYLDITATNCPENGGNSIVEVKTLQDKVILDIEFLCTCDCLASPGKSDCKNGGSLVCGVCECQEGFYGDKCECGSDDYSYDTSKDQNAKCMANEDDTKPCSGRGLCKCGRCLCHKPEYTGAHCQCHSSKCRGSNGELCSGNGICDCNECKCYDGFSGDHCQCDERACMPPGSTKMCSGHGKCDCDRCICSQESNVTYTGQYCEDCLSCGTGKCNKFKDCVQCVHFGIGPLKHDCNQCGPSQAVKSLEAYMQEGSRLCPFEDEEGCYLNFTYRYIKDLNVDEVFVQDPRKCPEPAPILSIVFSLIGVIVGIGVLTLILWKLITHIHDTREYARFVKERENIRFPAAENPIFVNPTTTTQNPMFSSQEVK